MKLYLNKNPLFIEKYQQLLVTQWNFETMRESLDLANSFLNSCKHPFGFSELLQDYGKSELSEFLTSSNFRNYLQNQVVFTSNKNFPNIPEKIPKRRSTSKIKYSKLTLEVIYNLAFPVFATNKKNKKFILDGEIGFLRDIQSLIFMLTSNIMLPLLKQHRLKEEINYLNLIMFTHSLMVWYDNPAHQNQLFSIVFDNMGFHEAVIDCLYIAFRLTLPDDHDYLTKAQAYWSALIDAKMFDKAKEFSLKLLRYSSEKHFEEIKEIIELTFELEQQ